MSNNQQRSGNNNNNNRRQSQPQQQDTAASAPQRRSNETNNNANNNSSSSPSSTSSPSAGNAASGGADALPLCALCGDPRHRYSRCPRFTGAELAVVIGWTGLTYMMRRADWASARIADLRAFVHEVVLTACPPPPAVLTAAAGGGSGSQYDFVVGGKVLPASSMGTLLESCGCVPGVEVVCLLSDQHAAATSPDTLRRLQQHADTSIATATATASGSSSGSGVAACRSCAPAVPLAELMRWDSVRRGMHLQRAQSDVSSPPLPAPAGPQNRQQNNLLATPDASNQQQQQQRSKRSQGTPSTVAGSPHGAQLHTPSAVGGDGGSPAALSSGGKQQQQQRSESPDASGIIPPSGSNFERLRNDIGNGRAWGSVETVDGPGISAAAGANGAAAAASSSKSAPSLVRGVKRGAGRGGGRGGSAAAETVQPAAAAAAQPRPSAAPKQQQEQRLPSSSSSSDSKSKKQQQQQQPLQDEQQQRQQRFTRGNNKQQHGDVEPAAYEAPVDSDAYRWARADSVLPPLPSIPQQQLFLIQSGEDGRYVPAVVRARADAFLPFPSEPVQSRTVHFKFVPLSMTELEFFDWLTGLAPDVHILRVRVYDPVGRERFQHRQRVEAALASPDPAAASEQIPHRIYGNNSFKLAFAELYSQAEAHCVIAVCSGRMLRAGIEFRLFGGHRDLQLLDAHRRKFVQARAAAAAAGSAAAAAASSSSVHGAVGGMELTEETTPAFPDERDHYYVRVSLAKSPMKEEYYQRSDAKWVDVMDLKEQHSAAGAERDRRPVRKADLAMQQQYQNVRETRWRFVACNFHEYAVEREISLLEKYFPEFRFARLPHDSHGDDGQETGGTHAADQNEQQQQQQRAAPASAATEAQTGSSGSPGSVPAPRMKYLDAAAAGASSGGGGGSSNRPHSFAESADGAGSGGAVSAVSTKASSALLGGSDPRSINSIHHSNSGDGAGAMTSSSSAAAAAAATVEAAGCVAMSVGVGSSRKQLMVPPPASMAAQQQQQQLDAAETASSASSSPSGKRRGGSIPPTPSYGAGRSAATLFDVSYDLGSALGASDGAERAHLERLVATAHTVRASANATGKDRFNASKASAEYAANLYARHSDDSALFRSAADEAESTVHVVRRLMSVVTQPGTTTRLEMVAAYLEATALRVALMAFSGDATEAMKLAIDVVPSDPAHDSAMTAAAEQQQQPAPAPAPRFGQHPAAAAAANSSAAVNGSAGGGAPGANLQWRAFASLGGRLTVTAAHLNHLVAIILCIEKCDAVIAAALLNRLASALALPTSSIVGPTHTLSGAAAAMERAGRLSSRELHAARTLFRAVDRARTAKVRVCDVVAPGVSDFPVAYLTGYRIRIFSDDPVASSMLPREQPPQQQQQQQ